MERGQSKGGSNRSRQSLPIREKRLHISAGFVDYRIAKYGRLTGPQESGVSLPLFPGRKCPVAADVYSSQAATERRLSLDVSVSSPIIYGSDRGQRRRRWGTVLVFHPPTFQMRTIVRLLPGQAATGGRLRQGSQERHSKAEKRRSGWKGPHGDAPAGRLQSGHRGERT
jgi:hypothetical protein